MAGIPPIQALSREGLLKGDGNLDPEKLLHVLNQFVTSVSSGLNRQLTFGQNFAATLKQVRLVMPPESAFWTDAGTLSNSWADYGAGFPQAAYRIEPGGRVTIRGLIKSGTVTAATVLFALPSGYRPAEELIFATRMNGPADCEIRVQADGDVTLGDTGGNASWTSLDGISFFATTPAAPKTFTSSGWPVLVRHDLPKCVGLVPVACRLLDGPNSTAAEVPTLNWEDKGDGQVRIKAAWGLQPSKTYFVTCLMFAG